MITSKAVIYEKYGTPLFVDEIKIGDPKPNDVVVKMYASGICGSQLLNLNNTRSANPEILGHEGTGVVVKAGKNVKHVKEGDQVLISWMPYGADENTEYLEWCESVEWNGKTLKTLIFTWAEHTIVHSQFVSKMDVDFEKYTTSIVGCAGIAGYGTVLNTVKIKPNNSVAVFGVGGLGLLAVNAAKKLKANPIIAIDLDDEKLEFSKKFGATHTVNSKKNDPIVTIKEISKAGVDYVFDMVGSAAIREQTIMASKEGIVGYNEGGTTVMVGFPHGASEFNPRSILMGQRTYKGSRGGACIPQRDFPDFYSDYKKGDLLLDEIVTRRIKMEEINDALQDLENGKVLGRMIIEIA
jgi:Zn-dependent alcohol dehydrogenase